MGSLGTRSEGPICSRKYACFTRWHPVWVPVSRSATEFINEVHRKKHTKYGFKQLIDIFYGLAN